ncbi:hypothetical protein [Streptomyces iakyrus]|uniref:Uncharacterized protein n=1 Tax=Streptomyces iakyrus TaxID=68219 RepID=A0ABW8FAL0_9ACTN
MARRVRRGAFGDITAPGIERTIGACAQLRQAGGTVVRTRHRGEPGPGSF